MPAPALPAIAVSASDPSWRPRVRKVQFGDGYALREPEGLNSVPATWEVKWRGLPQADAETLADFFLARKGAESFTWQPDGEDAAQEWVCVRWSKRRLRRTLRYDVSATFERAF